MQYQVGWKYSVRLSRAGSNAQSIMVEAWRVAVMEFAEVLTVR